MQLRPYQEELKRGLYASWAAGNRNVVLVSPTGSGKTVIMGSIASDTAEPGCVIAHRTELVSQISMTMARFGIRHNIVAAKATTQFCITKHVSELGRSFYDARAMVTVASVDTLTSRSKDLTQWASVQKWWMIDEFHHVLAGNKWGRAIGLFKNARGVGVTATPVRADHKSLHADQGGVAHDMIVGPTMRYLIDNGSLSEYRIFAPPQSIDLSEVKLGADGEYSQPGLREASHKSRIVGDIVNSYVAHANGLRGITFVVDVEQAVETAANFNARGIPAMAVSSDTPDAIREAAISKLSKGIVLQLVNVGLFSEGLDIPSVEVVSMGRPTMSYGLYVQQFGRALRKFDGKTHGIIIDHVGNVKRHNLPDAPRKWTLYAEERGKKQVRDPDVIPLTTCTNEGPPPCFQAYPAIHRACPFCGHSPEPTGRSRPEQVDGDLIELDAATLATMRGEASRIDGEPQIPFGASEVVEGAVRKRWRERQEAQATLRHAIALWAGVWRDRGDTDSMIYRRFFFRFDTDIMTAQGLGRAEADELKERITHALAHT